MKRLMFVLSMIAFIVPTIAFAVNVGDTATVPNWEWVDVLNHDYAHSGNDVFHRGDMCGIERGGTVSVISMADSGFVLVRYTSPDYISFGTSCPDNVEFQLSEQKFASMQKFHLIATFERLRKALVRKYREHEDKD